jgi:sugar phosphate isomerase/epimerase
MDNRPSFLSRRSFLAAACLARPAAAKSTFRIGVTDWNLKLSSKLEAVALAADLGFQGVEVSLGRTPVGGKLPLADEALQDRYLAAARDREIALAGTCLDILHVNYLKSDKLGQNWVADGIPITKRLNAKVMLLPFFGKGALGTPAEFDYIGDLLRELGPEAEKSSVILALENTVNAADNLRMLERSRSRAVKIYYDCGNLAHSGFDPIAELQAMGRDRIAQVHLKDNPHYLGEGNINLPRIVQILQEMGYSGFANLETDAPSRDIAADMRRNLAYIRRLTG